MFTNKIGCTVYEKTVQDHEEAYIRHFIPIVYWENTRAQTQSGTTMVQADAVFCSIPATSLSDYMPRKDDVIVCGRCEDEEPPEEGLTIMSVDDFLYGSADVQHLEVTAV